MLSLNASTSFPSTRALRSSSLFLPRSTRLKSYNTLFTSSPSSSESSGDEPVKISEGAQEQCQRSNFAGITFEKSVENGSEKTRLDSWLSSHIQHVSRARVQSSIRLGLVNVNGKPVNKVSHMIKAGDRIECTISELRPLRAEPEDIPLNIIYEDPYVLVVNKPPHMVVHPAPGNANGTLVSAILHHCRLPAVGFASSDIFSEEEDEYDNVLHGISSGRSADEDKSSIACMSSIRPGIVHRLDKGTSGLLVVAKEEHSHANLSEQFKLHTIHRVYISLTCGAPSPNSGRIEIPIARDSNNRVRMTAVTGTCSSRWARHAASRYRVIEFLAGGGSALVEWRLETGRTHQIRVHAKYLGIPLLGDEVYGGTKSMALSQLRPRTPSRYHGHLSSLISNIERPCLHALSLGFKHPYSGEYVKFSCPPPPDFAEVLCHLQKIKTKEETRL